MLAGGVASFTCAGGAEVRADPGEPLPGLTMEQLERFYAGKAEGLPFDLCRSCRLGVILPPCTN